MGAMVVPMLIVGAVLHPNRSSARSWRDPWEAHGPSLLKAALSARDLLAQALHDALPTLCGHAVTAEGREKKEAAVSTYFHFITL
jgi:hypothetical protein